MERRSRCLTHLRTSIVGPVWSRPRRSHRVRCMSRAGAVGRLLQTKLQHHFDCISEHRSVLTACSFVSRQTTSPMLTLTRRRPRSRVSSDGNRPRRRLETSSLVRMFPPQTCILCLCLQLVSGVFRCLFPRSSEPLRKWCALFSG